MVKQLFGESKKRLLLGYYCRREVEYIVIQHFGES